MKLPLLSRRQVLSTLKRLGFVELSRKGSHVKMKHDDGRKIVIPYHDEINRYTLRGALKDAEVNIKEFINKIK
jgi:predicted RNA binding protein YcfA (HicA-like mRNA interferase family)